MYVYSCLQKLFQHCKCIAQAVCHMLLQLPFVVMPTIPSSLHVLTLVFCQHYRYAGIQYYSAVSLYLQLLCPTWPA